jgi:choline dehydrogenase-like flavoprotein
MLSASHRSVLEAVARRVVPHAFENGGVDLIARIEERLAHAPPDRVRDLELALTVFGSRVSALCTGMLAPFPRLSASRQDAMLARWSTSRLLLARSVFHGVRRLVVAVYYSLPDAFEDIGYLGPLHAREPQLSWEGPVRTRDATPHVDEPIMRVRPGQTWWPPTLRETREHGRLTAAAVTDHRITADAVIVGSGAGGSVAATRLAEHGWDVVVVEEGNLVSLEELNEREGDMTARLYAERGMRATDDLSFMLLQGGAVGGGTLVNWMITFRTPDHVLDEWRSRFKITGFSSSELAPVFASIEEEIHVSEVPNDAHSPANRILLDGARTLDWRASSGRINARGCVRAGFCGQGCRYGAKQSVDRVFLPRALVAGARLVADARADRIEIIERDAAASSAVRSGRRSTAPLKRVHVTRLDPITRTPVGSFVIDAPVVMLGAGAIATPAILQRSGFGGGGVGKFLRLHPTTAVVGEHADDVYGAAGIPQSAVCDEFSRRDDHGYGFWIECAPIHPALASVALNGIGAEHRELMRRFRKTANVIVLVRDGSDLDASNGSVTVSSKGRVRISYRIGVRDRANLVAGVEAGARILMAAGLTGVRTLHTRGGALHNESDVVALRSRGYGPLDLTMFSAHVNGTCRLGTDPRTSAVDSTGQRHGVRGLYVADGSLLPTALGVNPQLTIMALSSVIADRIAAGG